MPTTFQVHAQLSLVAREFLESVKAWLKDLNDRSYQDGNSSYSKSKNRDYYYQSVNFNVPGHGTMLYFNISNLPIFVSQHINPIKGTITFYTYTFNDDHNKTADDPSYIQLSFSDIKIQFKPDQHPDFILHDKVMGREDLIAGYLDSLIEYFKTA